MSDIWKPHVVVAAVIERDGRFLLVEEQIEGQRVFNQPAGHLDPNETLTAAVARETLEESAWEFVPKAMTGIYLMRLGETQPTYLRFTFCGVLGKHHPERPLDKEILRTHWLTREEIAARRDHLRSPLVEQSIDDYLAGVRLPLDALKHAGIDDPAEPLDA